MIKKSLVMSILILTLFFSMHVNAESLVSILNPGFEEPISKNDQGWSESSWKKDVGAVTFFQDDKIFKTGNKSVAITNHVPNDSRYLQEIKVKPGYFYKISCWIKTENVGTNAKGANISIHEVTSTSSDLRETTNGWEYVELYGKAGSDQKSFILTLGLGGYGSLNTGKVWFDDVKVEEFKTLPQGVSAVNLYSTASSSSSSLQNNIAARKDFNFKIIWIFILYILTIAIIGVAYYKIYITKYKGAKNKLNDKSYATRYFLYIVLVSSFLLRLLFAPVIDGHPIDMNCFKSWASLASNNLPGFYNNDTFVDYPPVYIYILYLMANIAKLFGFFSVQWAYTLIIKLPSIIADIVTAYFIYKIAESKLPYKWSVVLTALYAFNPVLILNSTIWGQVDSFFTMLIVGALWCILCGKLEWSSVLFCTSILMKPQGIIFLPVLFFQLLKNRDIREIIKCFIYALITAAVIILPFSRDPLWIFRLFLNTASGYKGATVNAFNFFAFLGANWKDDSLKLFIFSYKTWGLIFDISILAFTGYLYLKGKSSALPFISAMVLITGAFVMSNRMHERYMFPVMALTLLVYIISKDKRLLTIYALSSLTGFINTYMVLELSVKEVYWVPANDIIMRITSLTNVLLMIYMFIVSLDIALRKNQV